ncbi:MAG: hypothetical protein GY911_07440, partial [Actinomycetales bacterium]|nr:hypothetical protein [Actinomycetales bacterium]
GTFADADSNGVPDICDQPGGADGILDVPSEYATIAMALDLVPEGGVIRLGAGVYTEAIDFGGQAITIEGDASAPETVIIDGTSLNTSIVRINSGEGPGSVLRGLTIRNGTGVTVGGGLFTSNTSPLIEDCVFESNSAGRGGAVYARFGEPVFRRCRFVGNQSEDDGGGIQFNQSQGGLVEFCVFESNQAGRYGGGIHIVDGTLVIEATVFSANGAISGGGAISRISIENPQFPGGTTLVSNCGIVANSSPRGGGVWVSEHAEFGGLLITATTVCENSSYNFFGPYVDLGGNSICPNGPIQWSVSDGGNGHWYEVRNAGLTWEEARVVAIASGGTLASITSEAESEELRGIMSAFGGTTFQIGGLQTSSEDEPAGSWAWVTGEPFGFTDWNFGEPDNGGGESTEQRMAFYFADASGGWNDINGDGTDPYIVEWSADCNGDGIVDYGQILDGSVVDEDGDGVPDDCPTAGLFDPKLAMAGSFSIAIDAEGELIIWGGSGAILDVPEGIVDPVAVSAWSEHALVLQADGGVVAWGRNDFGQADVPDSLPPAVAIATLDKGSLAIHADGSVTGWGENSNCGAGTGYLDVPFGVEITEISGGNVHWLYRKTDGTVAGRGCNFNGQWNVPASAQPPIDFEANESWSCVLAPDGTIAAFGYGGFGRLNTPGGSDFIDIACGAYSGLGLRSDGTVVAWGDNGAGQGNVPATLENVIAVEAGLGFSAVIHEDGTLTMWGTNATGQSDPPADLQVRLYDEDCDGDGVADWEAILRGIVDDVNQDGRPDGCDCLEDTDGDGIADCDDLCPNDPNKTDPGTCGCGDADTDTDGDGIADCIDPCPTWPYDCSEDGQTIFVTVDQSIQQAIDVVPAGGTILLAAGTYAEAVDFGSKNLVLEGDVSDPSSVVLDGTGATDTLVRISGGQTPATVVRGLTIRNGPVGMLLTAQGIRVGGGMVIRNCDPMVEGVVFSANRSQFGGGLYVLNSESVLSGCSFVSNVADEDGGGLFVQNADMQLTGGMFDGNTAANQGGAVKVVIGESVLSNCVMTSNVANEGGGIYWFANVDTPPLVVDGCLVTGNLAISSGGGIKTRAGNPGVDSFNTTICDNSPGQISGPYTDLGGNCISEVCDTDADGTLDCDDNCPEDPNKTEPGDCGCGVEDTDADGDGITDCNDPCPNWPYDCSEDGQTIFVSADQSIQAAIDVVPDGGTVAIAAGTFSLTGPLDPGGRAMAIRGPTDADGIPTSILDGQNSTRVLFCQSGETADTVFENLVIRNGYSDFDGGGMFNVGSSPALRNCRFVENLASGLGGGMANLDSSSPTLVDCVFLDNSANDGGGLANELGSSPELTNCTFAGNTASESGAGGGIFNRDSSDPTLLGCTVTSNSARYGGGMHNKASSPILVNCLFEGNSAGLWGGGMHSFESSPVLNNCTFQGNSTDVGGRGGGMYNNASSTTLASCSFEGNSAGNGGGGMFNNAASTSSLVECTLCSNTPDQILGDYTDLGSNCISEVCDSDGDGTLDCIDDCPEDPDKTEPGDCGCGVEDTDTDGDGIADCIDPCPNWPYDCSEDGQTILVTADQSIQTAIDVVPDGGTLLLAAGTYTEAIDFGSKNLVLEGDVSDPSSV